MLWTVVAGVVPITLLSGLGVWTGCYRQAYDGLPRFMLEFMFACCLCTLPLVLLGRSLLRRAAWLR